MNGWEEYQLDEVIKKFIDYRGKTPKKVSSGIPLITAKVIKDGTILPPDEFIEADEYSSWMTRGFPKVNDVLLTTEAPLGEVAIVHDANIALAQRIILLRGKSDVVDNGFLFYSLRTGLMQHRLSARASGSTVQGIKSAELKKVLIPLPDIDTQKEIVKILSCLDRKIENLRKQNETLEAIAQTLFKHWFVDFEFPNADGKPYKSSGGVMEPSELGEIPAGWRVSTLGDEFDIAIGRTPPRKESEWFSIDIKDVKWASIKDMGSCGTYIFQTSEYLTREAVEQFNIPVIPANTVILSFKLTVGRVAITPEAMLSNEAIAHIKTSTDSPPTEYIYLFLSQFNFDKLGSTSSIATAVNSKSIKELEIVVSC